MNETLPADPALRRIAVAVMGGIIVAGTAAYFALERWLAGLRAAPPAQAREELLDVFAWATGVVAVMVGAIGVHAWRLGDGVRSTGTFPPPGTRVLRETVVIRGPAARRRGLIFKAAGGALVVLAIALVAMAIRLVAALAERAA